MLYSKLMDKIEELLTRGVEKIYPSKEELEKILRSGKKLKLYQGFDPTSPNLHIGHMVGLRKLKQWQNLGHTVIFLIGDFTGMIGDPSGKDTARNPLTKEQVLKNAKTYKEQASKILRFEGNNPVQIKFNSEWLGKMTASDFLRLARNVTYSQVAERDMFQKRLKKGKDVYINEFLYPIMQAYDSVFMDVDVEIGGSDQTFNMLMGRKLMRNMKQREKFVMTTPLLTDPRGVKIGKTEENVIALTDKPSDLFGKIMSLSDYVIVKGLEYLTDTPMDKIREMDKHIKRGDNPMPYKKKLAFEVVKQLSSHDEAHKAQKQFESGGLSTISNVTFTKNFVSEATIAQAMLKSGLATSLSDAKRVTLQGGTVINDQKVTDPNAPLKDYVQDDRIIIQRGDRRGSEVKIEK